MYYYVYTIQSKKNKRWYTGFTVDPVRSKMPAKSGSSADHAFQAGRTSNGIVKCVKIKKTRGKERYILKQAWVSAT